MKHFLFQLHLSVAVLWLIIYIKAKALRLNIATTIKVITRKKCYLFLQIQTHINSVSAFSFSLTDWNFWSFETRMFLPTSSSRTCQLSVCVIFLLFQWPSLPLSFSFYGYVINWNMLKSKRKKIRLLVPKILSRHVLVNRFFTFKNWSAW